MNEYFILAHLCTNLHVALCWCRSLIQPCRSYRERIVNGHVYTVLIQTAPFTITT